MTAPFSIRCYLADTNAPVTPDRPVWHRPLPGSAAGRRMDPARSPVTIGDYLTTATEMVSANGGRRLAAALACDQLRPIEAGDIRRVDCYLEKHGALYHPIRLAVTLPDTRIDMAMNGAVTDGGRRCMAAEIPALLRLNRRFPGRFVPQLYDQARLRSANGMAIRFFWAQWFTGFHEFHFSRPSGGAAPAVKVWLPGAAAGRPLFLDESQMLSLFRRSAELLTETYDVDSGRQIFPWHHAAGDFVVRLGAKRLQIRMITVRGYTSRLSPASKRRPPDPATRLQQLLIFLLQLTLRMRVDRLDGVGPRNWAPEPVVAAVLDGFFRALDRKSESAGLPVPPGLGLRLLLAKAEARDLEDLGSALLGTYPSDSTEADWLGQRLPAHTQVLMGGLHEHQFLERYPWG